MLCWITVAGTQLLGGLDEDVDRADVEVLHMLGAEEVGRLIDLLDSIRGEMRAHLLAVIVD